MKSPLVVDVFGGLGNQMFQHACGRALSLDLGVELRVRGTAVLGVFRGTAERASLPDAFRAGGLLGASFAVRRMVARYPHVSNGLLSGMVTEPHFEFWAGLEGAVHRGARLLHGYWQSEKYFRRHERQVRSDFTFPEQLTPANREIAAEIASTNAVSVHVRRGDYLTPRASAFHGACSADYYRRAFELMERKVDGPCFYIFSDDPAWVRSELAGDDGRRKIVIDHNPGAASFNDMHLMSLCKHHILANSTFSWWGAWLNASPGKIVVAPARWFASPDMNSADILPADWIRL